MGKAWRQLDLEGGGLQAVNAVLAAGMRTRPRAYAAWLLFPLGLHRFYLEDRRGGAAFLLLSAATLLAVLLAPGHWWLLPLLPLLALAAYDLFRIEDRVVAFNKELRMRLFLRKGYRPPREYRGRYPEEDAEARASEDLAAYTAIKERERAGHAPAEPDRLARQPDANRRVPSFSEQEALLRQLHAKRGSRAD
jgi:TM2 domain-containing membrane protein YozV